MTPSKKLRLRFPNGRFQLVWWWPVSWIDDDGDWIVKITRPRFGKRRWPTLYQPFYRWSFHLGPLEIRRWANR